MDINPQNKYQTVCLLVQKMSGLVKNTRSSKELFLKINRLICSFMKSNSSTVVITDSKSNQIQYVVVMRNGINIIFDKKNDFKSMDRIKDVINSESIIEKRCLGIPFTGSVVNVAVFIERSIKRTEFTNFDREILTIFANLSGMAFSSLFLQKRRSK